ncbi:V-type ATP synthase subunit I [Peptoniphilus sp. BV3C26]|uniref:V-type ATP synthase subunit I n=1 Tax=Peptoniphilus sp. BV3C26 TaxID=1111134 RepID=UPI001EE1A9AA|nr:V-type ATPase 116kDa subunit family protein [Peptoniphilus sp. BV3C26]
MKIINLAGDLSEMDQVIAQILKSKMVNIINAQLEIENNAFNYSLENEQNLERTIELSHISSFERDENSEIRSKQAEKLMDFFKIKDLSDYYDKGELLEDTDSFFEDINRDIDEIQKIDGDLKRVRGIKNNYDLFKNVQIDLSDLSNLDFFNVRFGILDKEARFRLKKNYGNILAVIFHTATSDEGEVYLAIYPKEVTNEIDRILKSLNWQDVEILGKSKGTAKEILGDLDKQEEDLTKRKKEILEKRDNFLRENKGKIESYIVSMFLKDRIEEVKHFMARSNKYFYMSGWIAERDIPKLKEILRTYKDIVIKVRSPEEDNVTPPTKLKNSFFARPFELLIKMYGVPNYKEKDPTFLFAVTYMFLFGAMFGDVGQGLVFFMVGFLIKNKDFGGLLKRLGIASTIFGFLYGSVFGMESIIPAIFMRPFSNINTSLMSAILVGLIFLLISYFVGFINKFNFNDLEEAIFGKEGLAGFIVFLMVINLACGPLLKKTLIPTKIAVIIIVLSLLSMVFKRQILSLITKKPHKIEEGYYIEAVFSLLEGVLSIVSNIISFIRVGAFAINHVGLFLAFETIGKMLNNEGLNILSLVIGNIVIIGLEGLIVFIQSLRLEYYEMFSKFYYGDGYEFIPTTIELEEK